MKDSIDKINVDINLAKSNRGESSKSTVAGVTNTCVSAADLGGQENELSQDQSDDEDIEPFIEIQLLNKLKFQQSSERKNWQGINVRHAGIPGNVTLNFNER